jgi:SepF-like predicted cell division protein (DUF552 family)
MGFLSKIKETLLGKDEYANIEQESAQRENEYVEIDSSAIKDAKKKVLVKTYYIDEFEDIKEILDDLREGATIALINIKPIKEKDIIELKRAINKIKKTCDAIEGEIAGFGEDYIIVVPSFAKIHRSTNTSDVKEDPSAGKQ